ncbi:gamma-L-glutamyl-butirosin B gamma-L-glutamyl cyclotransferase [Salisediminibacterium halotolerans]|uniref:gamma-glutamylcyclotransferase family protein n=1 Tax=Salisediminibacterium halotolerans TaxID=517425 RepID=UPI000F1D8CE2|nr:gamma-glutamylcyclotransferase family protein [Salisediminibacterium halotolerans]RLJ74391.1 gamma-L-glutamyl-butirosin B gamma-L-glutamyl cyclotransferase [Actinophytocola xinjiangensis]RPE87516.1 gamma-L-glutamyl-butirosin B gamma-L-glutamyl cyclotransferase [Salisediminibacterium halotolerans]TWG35228.1 gamma-L-glutamyl-butirosin B gamma-L-glutamyl cyclotransferase [Salisediminibacterium halotolerans]
MLNQHILVFVYGTLLKGEPNHGYLTEAACLEEHCCTNGRLVDTGEGYPALIKDDYAAVKGELYAVTDSQLKNINRLEGYFGENRANLYERKTLNVYSDSQTYSAFVYLFENPGNLPYITENDWRAYQQKTADD